jgi:hypothetical protein
MRSRSLPTGLFLCGCAALGAWGCASEGGGQTDFDGDRSPDALDCDPADPATYPGAPDPYGDGIDQDCDGGDGIDLDGDGYPANEELSGEELYDCNDNDPDINPGAVEVPGDQVDQDCDGLDGFVEVAISIAPAEPGTGDELVLTVLTDAEAWLVRWFLDDEQQTDLDDQQLVPSALTSEGQLWQAEVTPIASDNVLYGSRISTTVLIHNTPPLLESVSIAPAAPSEEVPLLASAVGMADADPSDTVSVIYRWFVNETEVLGWSGAELNGTWFDKHDDIRVEATPSDGSDDGALVSSETVTAVNTLPSATSAELFPTVVREDSIVTASLLGWSDPDPADSPEQAPVIWFVNSTMVSVEPSLDGSLFDSGDTIEAEVSPYDGEEWGAALVTPQILVGNTAPTLLTVVILPAEPTEDSVLSAELVGLSDPDPADVVQTQYSWTVNNAAAGSSPTLSGADFARGDVISVEVTPYDDTEFGASVTALPVIVQNSPPSMTSVSISPDPADVTVPFLQAVGSGFADPDGDSDQTSYEWFVGGVSVTTGEQLAPSNFSAGDLVEVVATPSDGLEQGAPVSAQITIANATPSVLTAAITPSSGDESTVFAVQGTGFSDPDGDAEDYQYQWYVNTQPSATTATLDGASFDRGDLISVEVTAWDGSAAGNTVASAPVSVLNTAPTLDSVTLSPADAFTDTEITCAAIDATDLDGDSLSTTYTWLIGGVATIAPDSPTLDGAGEAFPGQTWFDKGDEVSCTVTISDGSAPPVSVTSAQVTIANSPPTLTQADLVPGAAYTFTQLTCLASGYSDADGDPVSYTWNWYVGGALAATSTSLNTLDPSLMSRGDTVWCEAIASDGTEPSTPAQSGSLVVANTPPTAPVLAWSPGTPQIGTALACVVDTPASDIDGDTFTYHWRWYLDGAAEGSLDDLDTVPAAQVQSGDRWACQVWADDGTPGPLAEKSVYLFGAGISFPPVIEASDMQQLAGRNMRGADYRQPGVFALGTRLRLIQNVGDPPTDFWVYSNSDRLKFVIKDFTSDYCVRNFEGVNFDIRGASESTLVDLNGDGLKDVLRSTHNDQANGYSSAGRTLVWFQPAAGFPTSGWWDENNADLEITGIFESHNLGGGAAVGDVNADGYNDLVLAAAGDGGGSYLFYGPLPAGTWNADVLGLEVAPALSNFWRERMTVSGDFDGDGYDDFAIQNGSQTGGLLMIYGRAGTSPQPAVGISVPGTCQFDFDRMMAAGDFDGDGYDDFICREENPGSGLDYILLWGGPGGLGAHGSTIIDVQTNSSTAAPWPTSSPILDDIDGDGAADLLVLMAEDTGEPRNDGNFALFLGGSRPTAPLTAADAAVVFSGDFTNNTDFEYCDIVPDLDGGGIKDIACLADDDYIYVHLVEDTDLDGDLSSLRDCDADDGDNTVQ